MDRCLWRLERDLAAGAMPVWRAENEPRATGARRAFYLDENEFAIDVGGMQLSGDIDAVLPDRDEEFVWDF